MNYASLVYNLLTNVFWSITPAFPGSGVTTRPDVGFPEIIPDKIFITRELIPTDGVFAVREREHLNGFVQGARRFHTMYGLTLTTVNSIEDILNHFRPLTTPVRRIRLVSHGSDQFLFVPVFNGGLWDFGTDPETLVALQNSDEDGLRFLVTRNSALPSPILIDGVSQMLSGITSLNSAVVTPLGTQPFTPEVQRFVELVNDFYQVRNGTIGIGAAAPFANLTPPQETILNASLTLVENAVRARVLGVAGTTITGPQLTAFKNAVLAATPVELEFLGPSFALSPTVIADVTAAMSASPRVEDDIRTAIVALRQPLFLDHLRALILGLMFFHPAVLTLGGTDHDDTTIIGGDPDLEAFCFACADLHFLKNGPLFIGTTPVTAGQRTTLRNAVMAISDIIRIRILGAPSNTITNAQLNTLRTTIENLPLRRSAITGGTMTLETTTFRELNAANNAMQHDFRTKLNHFRGLMKPDDASFLDIRGCLVGRTPSFLDVLRNFLGGVNQPTVSAPEFFQSFPAGVRTTFDTDIFAVIDSLVSSGLPASNVSAADVDNAVTTWQGLIDFDPHFDFISDLFTVGSSKQNFAMLGWRVFRVGTATTGIPVLRMEARRADDLVSLNLGKIIERFGVIFQIPAASVPNAAARTRLTKLQPHLVTFQAKKDAVAGSPTPADLTVLFTDLTTLANKITAIPGFPAPAVPLVPASDSLPDIAASVVSIGNHLDTILDAALDPFFAAVQGRLSHANAKIRYFYNIGLPLLLQSSSTPIDFVISVRVSLVSATDANKTIDAALRSWMRIQWSGDPAQTTAMNKKIRDLPLGTSPKRTAASQVSALTERDPIDVPTSETGIAPMQAFHDHIITRP